MDLSILKKFETEKGKPCILLDEGHKHSHIGSIKYLKAWAVFDIGVLTKIVNQVFMLTMM